MSEFIPTKEQGEILKHRPGRHARVLAGPGTGKSVTLVALLDRILTENADCRIRLLTFTRAATRELVKKVSQHAATTNLRPSTIHSFAISVLLANPGAGDLPQPLRIPDDWERDQIILPNLADRVCVYLKVIRLLIAELSANWQSLQAEDDSKIGANDRDRFRAVWNEDRKIFGYTLLDELPYALRNSLDNYPDLKGIDYDMLIVDEYQDLNACDLEVLRLLSQRNRSASDPGCTVIGAGDDDQSIYSRRKAAPEGIRRFLEDYPGAADYPLSIAQRFGSKIIEWASHVIRNDPDRSETRPQLTAAASSFPGVCGLLSFANQEQEAEGVASLLCEFRRKIPLPEILVLLRSDYASQFSAPLKEILTRNHIPFSDPESLRMMLADESNRRMIEILRLLVHREDSISWASLLQLTNGIGERFVQKIYQLARDSHQSFGEALLAAYVENFPLGPARAAQKATSLIRQVSDWLDLHQEEVGEVERKWGHWIVETADGVVIPKPTPEFGELLLALDDHVEPKHGLGRYLGQIAPLGKDKAQSESKGVRIMTMGSAKGLTVQATIMMGLENEIIPHPTSKLSEERRLLYVAMTRSREYLFGTWARKRKGPTARVGSGAKEKRFNVYRRPSQFLDGGPVHSEDGPLYIQKFKNSFVG